MLICILNPRWAVEHLVHTFRFTGTKRVRASLCLVAKVHECRAFRPFAIAYLTRSIIRSLPPLYLFSCFAHFFHSYPEEYTLLTTIVTGGTASGYENDTKS